MLALLSLLDLVYMLRSTLAATLLKIIALPVPLRLGPRLADDGKRLELSEFALDVAFPTVAS